MKTLKEAIIDLPRKTYAKNIFDKADSNNPKLKPEDQPGYQENNQ